MTRRELFELASRLTREGVSFVTATVVRRDGLTSAHQGDHAIITVDGHFHGWIGGGCTRPTVEREAADVLRVGRPRLISLSPEPERDARPGVIALPMTCHSGGTVEIYLDPVIASPRVVLFGRSPMVVTLAALARAIGYRVDVVDPEARADEIPGADRVFTALDDEALVGPGASMVVASMGDLDEDAVVTALRLGPSYLGVVASRRRFALLRDALLARGIEVAALDRIANPAGLDLGARVAGEVAVSILAQIIARNNAVALVAELPAGAVSPAPTAVTPPAPIAAARSRMSLPLLGASAASASAAATATTPDPAVAKDPICGMSVTIATARHIGSWDQRTWYFCCAGCRTKFLADPGRYAVAFQPGVA